MNFCRLTEYCIHGRKLHSTDISPNPIVTVNHFHLSKTVEKPPVQNWNPFLFQVFVVFQCHQMR